MPSRSHVPRPNVGYRIRRLANRPEGWPCATLCHYGPDPRRATKAVVSIVAREGAEPDPIKTWHSSGDQDLREDQAVLAQMLAFLDLHSAKRVVMADRILGCPHQEGIDYEGDVCPDPGCAFWIDVDRFTHERRR